MASGLRDEPRPRRFDLTMSRRTRRAATSAATNCHGHQEEDHQAMEDPDGGELKGLTPQCPCLSDHMQSRQPLKGLTPQCPCLSDHMQSRQPEDDESEALQQQQQEEECQDNSRRFSLLELIEDEAVDGMKDDAAADGGKEENAAREVAEGAAADEAKPPGQVPARRVIGIMRRYVKVRSIKPKRASPEKNVAPVC